MEVINNLCQATQRILGSCFRSTLNRFASADSIVPNPTNPQSLNRYSYVQNNPVNKIDPTGHVDCSLLGDSGDTQGCNDAKPTPPRISKPDPPCTDVWCAIKLPSRPSRPGGIRDGTWNSYLTMFEQIWRTPYLLADGRMDDQFLLAVLIRVEFSTLNSGTQIYEAALEALSNQYQGYGCHGGCSSLAEQLHWLDAMQGWYNNRKQITIADCPRCLGDASRVMGGVNDGDGYDAWWWGNPKTNSAMDNYINKTDPLGRTTPSWGNDSLRGAFIIQDSIPSGGNYDKFLVVTYEQNIACGNYPGPLNCMGFDKP